MKSKASLVLMEQLIMVLIFALAAALCLGVFAKSSTIARETQQREQGAMLAQNAAELLKSGGDVRTLDTGDYEIVVTVLPSELPGYLSRADIRLELDGETVFQMETAWQEVAP